MTDSIEVGGPNVRASVRTHESGKRMICFNLFRLSSLKASSVLDLIDQARSKLKSLEIVRICLDADQTDLQPVLESLGFALDGIEYQFSPADVKAALKTDRLKLPLSFSVRQMNFDDDQAIDRSCAALPLSNYRIILDTPLRRSCENTTSSENMREQGIRRRDKLRSGLRRIGSDRRATKHNEAGGQEAARVWLQDNRMTLVLPGPLCFEKMAVAPQKFSRGTAYLRQTATAI